MKSKIKVDGVIAFILLATMLWADFVVYKTVAIPFKYRITAMAIITILSMLMLALTFKKLKRVGLWVRRVFSILLIVLLIIVNTLYLGKVGSMLKNATKQLDKNIEKISIVVKQDSKINELSDLKGKTIGYQDSTDKDNGLYVKKQIDKKVDKVTYESENNYFTLSEQLLNDEIDALIITNSFIASLGEKDENAAEEGADFEGKIKYIETYKREVKRIDRLHSGSDLDLTSEVFTVLVSGMDETGKPDHNGRCDVVMLLLVNPNTNHLEMISFPRDSYIPNPALNDGYDKLTHTGNHGVENTMEALENIVGFDINFYVKVNFSTVVEMVDALGGVTVDVPVAFTEQNSERSFAEGDLISLDAGVQEVNGEEALAFARHRKSAGVGDIGRTKAQQQVIGAMIKKVLTSEGALAVPNLMDIAGEYVNTNISEDQINDFVNDQLSDIQPWTFSQMTLENGASAMLTTASMGNTPLSCYVLNSYDLDKVYEKYQMMKNPISFSNFSFDLNNLEMDGEYASKRPNVDIVDTNSDLSPYQSQVEEFYEEEVEKTPEVVLPPTDSNDSSTEPETPTDPEVPPVTPPTEPEKPEPEQPEPEKPEQPLPPEETTPQS